MVALPDVRAVLFDKDGTLVDVEATWGPAMVAALTALVPDDSTRRRAAEAIGVHLDTARLVPDGPIIAESNGQICARLGPILGIDPEELVVTFEHHLFARASEFVTPLPGVGPVLDALKAGGCWVGLATNDAEQSARDQLQLLGWLDAFDSVIGYDSGFGEKPDPGMVSASVARAGVSADELVMVGDTDTDLGAAEAAGCRTVLVHAPPGRVAPSVRIDTLAELPGLLGF
ncbi:MAG: HAD family hydrolase [Actinomycetota bacterium]